MSELPQIAIQFDPEQEDIVDREIIREFRAGGTLESTAVKLHRDQGTIRRRMGAILIRLLKNEI